MSGAARRKKPGAADDRDERPVRIPAGAVMLEGALAIPAGAEGVVLFAHGSGSSRHSPRNNFVAGVLRRRGLATLLMDLLTLEEDRAPGARFNIDLLTERLEAATRWLMDRPETRDFRIGYFGASTGAAAALKAAARFGSLIGAVVSRGGRPDLALESLDRVTAPTLLIVGGLDEEVLRLNQQAYERLRTEKRLAVIPGATHLFGEPGALEEAAELAARWFEARLGQTRPAASGTA